METKQRYQTEAAQCAKLIRTELKQNFPNTKFRVISSNYSMGDSVNVYWTNGPSSKQVEEITNKHQDGDFNGYEDIYEYKSNPENLPRTKYLFCNRELSDEVIRNYGNKIAKDYQITAPGEDLSSSFEFMNDFLNWHQLAWKGLREVAL